MWKQPTNSRETSFGSLENHKQKQFGNKTLGSGLGLQAPKLEWPNSCCLPKFTGTILPHDTIATDHAQQAEWSRHLQQLLKSTEKSDLQW